MYSVIETKGALREYSGEARGKRNLLHPIQAFFFFNST